MCSDFCRLEITSIYLSVNLTWILPGLKNKPSTDQSVNDGRQVAPIGCIVISRDWQLNQVCWFAGGCRLLAAGSARLGSEEFSFTDVFKEKSSPVDHIMINWTVDFSKGQQWPRKEKGDMF